MPLFSTYSDLPDFLANSSPSQDTASLVGGNTTLSVGCAQGATSLTVGSVANFASSGSFPAFILDGASSEVVTASVSGASLSVPAGTLAAHGAGASVSSAGTAGCLADLIATASAMVETKCKQGAAGLDRSLWQQSRVEKLSGPTLRAAFDVDHSLVLRPFHFPVASVTSISVQMGAAISANLDTTYLFIPDGAKTLVIPWAQVLGTPPLGVSWIGGGPFPRNYGDAEQAFGYYDSDKKRVDMLAQAEKNAAFAYQAKQEGYKRGLNDLNTTLTAEANWRQARLSLAQAQVSLMQRSVQVFKALGGGWAPDAKVASR